MNLNSIPAEAAAWAVGISTKNVLTLTRRGILQGKREAIGERKHSYFYDWNEMCFLAVLVRFQKKFHIQYTFSMDWKKSIQDAMFKNIPFLIINSAGEVEPVGVKAEPLTMPIDLDKLLAHDAVILLNIRKLRSELYSKIESWK